jgi:hypothetical protein
MTYETYKKFYVSNEHIRLGARIEHMFHGLAYVGVYVQV